MENTTQLLYSLLQIVEKKGGEERERERERRRRRRRREEYFAKTQTQVL
jgi:hypothetical protein